MHSSGADPPLCCCQRCSTPWIAAMQMLYTALAPAKICLNFFRWSASGSSFSTRVLLTPRGGFFLVPTGGRLPDVRDVSHLFCQVSNALCRFASFSFTSRWFSSESSERIGLPLVRLDATPTSCFGCQTSTLHPQFVVDSCRKSLFSPSCSASPVPFTGLNLNKWSGPTLAQKASFPTLPVVIPSSSSSSSRRRRRHHPVCTNLFTLLSSSSSSSRLRSFRSRYWLQIRRALQHDKVVVTVGLIQSSTTSNPRRSSPRLSLDWSLLEAPSVLPPPRKKYFVFSSSSVEFPSFLSWFGNFQRAHHVNGLSWEGDVILWKQ